MCQKGIYDLVKREKRWMTNKQIASKIDISYSSVTVATKKLANAGFFEMKERKVPEESKSRNLLFYRYKKLIKK